MNIPVPVFIDSCAWNFLFDNAVDLNVELPSERFRLWITREVAIELAAIPALTSDGRDNGGLKRYVEAVRSERNVGVAGSFGFLTREADGSPSKVQVRVGFGQGGFQSKAEHAYYAVAGAAARGAGKSRKGSGLSADQADASLAYRARTSVVLTNERITKAGPLRAVAKEEGSKVVYLRDQVVASGKSLGEYLEAILER